MESHHPDAAGSSTVGSDALGTRLQEIVEMVATVLEVEHCSIMLLEETADAAPRLVVRASTVRLPASAYREGCIAGEGIAGHVLATGTSLLLEDIRQSRFAACARRTGDPRGSLMCVPIRQNQRPAGVVNVCGRATAGPFEARDLRLLEALAQCVAETLQVSQLQALLASRFAQLAVAQEAARGLGHSLALPNADQVVRLMAKAFYKEMTRAGFGSRQIINAATEIIAQLSGHLQRHSKRLGRDRGDRHDNQTDR